MKQIWGWNSPADEIASLIKTNDCETICLERDHVTESVLEAIIQNKSIRHISIFDGNNTNGIDIMMNYLLSQRDDIEVEIRQEGNREGDMYTFGDVYRYNTKDIFISLACEYGASINNIIRKWLEERTNSKKKHNNLFEEYKSYLLKNGVCTNDISK